MYLAISNSQLANLSFRLLLLFMPAKLSNYSESAKQIMEKSPRNPKRVARRNLYGGIDQRTVPWSEQPNTVNITLIVYQGAVPVIHVIHIDSYSAEWRERLSSYSIHPINSTPRTTVTPINTINAIIFLFLRNSTFQISPIRQKQHNCRRQGSTPDKPPHADVLFHNRREYCSSKYKFWDILKILTSSAVKLLFVLSC